jgi:hypothetical protein
MLRLSRPERASEGILEGRSALRKWVLREGIQVAIRLNQWAESCVRRAPLAGIPCYSISIDFLFLEVMRFLYDCCRNISMLCGLWRSSRSMAKE